MEPARAGHAAALCSEAASFVLGQGPGTVNAIWRTQCALTEAGEASFQERFAAAGEEAARVVRAALVPWHRDRER